MSVGDCRQTRSAKVYTGRFGWEDAPNHALVGVSGDHTTGEAELRCSAKIPPSAKHFQLRLGRIHISFEGQRETGSGIVIEVVADSKVIWTRKLLRVAGEDWVEQDARNEDISFPATPRRVSLLLRLVDVSGQEGFRVDIEGIGYDPN